MCIRDSCAPVPELRPSAPVNLDGVSVEYVSASEDAYDPSLIGVPQEYPGDGIVRVYILQMRVRNDGDTPVIMDSGSFVLVGGNGEYTPNLGTVEIEVIPHGWQPFNILWQIPEMESVDRIEMRAEGDCQTRMVVPVSQFGSE